MSQPPRSTNPSFQPVRLQHVMQEVRRPVDVRPDGAYTEIGVRSHGRGVFHKEPVTGQMLGTKRVFWLKPGTLVFNIVFAWERAVAVLSSAEQGMIGSHRFPTYEMIPGRANARFLKYYFTAGYGHFLLDLHSPGSAGRNRTLNQAALLKETVRLPPSTEQRAIADFLDRKIAALDALIGKKARLIELLAERRAAVIHRAVTRGLDPVVRLGDSEVAWVDRLPKHWGAVQLRRVLIGMDQGWSPLAEDRSKESGEWGVLKLSAVRGGQYRPDHHKTLPEKLDPRPEYVPSPGDILVSRANTPQLVGDSCVVDTYDSRLMLCDLLYRLRVDESQALPSFVDLFLRSAAGQALRTSDARGSSQSMVKLSQGHIKAWQIPLPPIDEQKQIVERLHEMEADYRATAGRIHESIAKLQEYRQTLITAAVTGQLDIPEAAA